MFNIEFNQPSDSKIVSMSKELIAKFDKEDEYFVTYMLLDNDQELYQMVDPGIPVREGSDSLLSLFGGEMPANSVLGFYPDGSLGVIYEYLCEAAFTTRPQEVDIGKEVFTDFDYINSRIKLEKLEGRRVDSLLWI